MVIRKHWFSVVLCGSLLAGCQSLLPVKETAPEEVAQNLAKPDTSSDTSGAQQEPQQPDELWGLTRSNMQLLDKADHPRVEQQLRWYLRHPSYMTRVSERASPYYHYILNEVLKRGMPAELALLPVVESAYDPFAYSHGRAAGPWQFIPGTAKYFGLKKSWWYDGRRDIIASTDAALNYLERLHKRFDGDWLLALAAYNAGGGNVNKALRKNRKAGKPTDFWSLDLPRETEQYVPKLLAVSRLVMNSDKFGIQLTEIDNKPYFSIEDTGGQLDLAQAAELAGIDTEDLYQLNPGFNHWATDPSGPHRLLIPVDKADQFRSGLAELPKKQRMKWTRYKVKSGDALSLIAKRFNTTSAMIQANNNLDRNIIRVGQTLLIPTASENASAYTLSKAQRYQSKQARIARTSSKQKVTYAVRSGDSFWSIAKKYKVGVRQLASWNQLAPGDPLRVGQKLNIWLKQDSASIAANKRIRKVGYKVRSGDNLSNIANRFRVSVSDIERWNPNDTQGYLQPGDKLTLYVDVTRAR